MSNVTYDVFPLDAAPERAEILSQMMRRIAATDNVFADYAPRCAEDCVLQGLAASEMCQACFTRMSTVAASITAPTTRTWEVWRTNGADPDLAGVISLTDILPGVDAKAHYIFFDECLADKTPVMQDMIAWVFEDHEGWPALRRLTIEIPRPFAALARHASRRLGFGGPFRYVLKTTPRGKTSINVEGVKCGAVMWRGTAQDLLILGLQREDLQYAHHRVPAHATHATH